MAQTIPLSVPDDLLEEVRETARLTHLSVQDVFRQSTKIGLSSLRESAQRVPRPRRLSLWDALPSGDAVARKGNKLRIVVPKDNVRKVIL